MKSQIDTRLWLKANGLVRQAALRMPFVQTRSCLVNEYPKSGGSWLTAMLSEALDLPFARNRLPYATARQIFHGHYSHPGRVAGMPTVVLWRDGRDVMVSHYFHALFYNDKGNKVLVDRTRARVPFTNYTDIAGNLPTFIELVTQGELTPPYSWQTFADRWAGRSDCVHAFYENLYDDGAAALQEVIRGIGREVEPGRVADVVARHSIAQARGQQAAEPASNDSRMPFVRRGGYGGWVDYFTPEAAEAFRDTHGDALLALGYERDHGWVDRVRVGAVG